MTKPKSEESKIDEPSEAGDEAALESPLIEEPELAPEVDHVLRLEAEVADLKDQLLRALAEVENVRRRAQRERDDSLRYATAPLLKDLLGVADNLSRALQSIPANDLEQDPRIEPLVTGVRLTEKELLGAFERHKVTRIDPLGERLDPHRHEAMFEIEDPEQPAGTVVQVMQPGYLLHDRLLRPARVAVAKGGPPAAKAPAPEAEAQPQEDQEPAPAGPPGSHIDTEA